MELELKNYHLGGNECNSLGEQPLFHRPSSERGKRGAIGTIMPGETRSYRWERVSSFLCGSVRDGASTAQQERSRLGEALRPCDRTTNLTTSNRMRHCVANRIKLPEDFLDVTRMQRILLVKSRQLDQDSWKELAGQRSRILAHLFRTVSRPAPPPRLPGPSSEP